VKKKIFVRWTVSDEVYKTQLGFHVKRGGGGIGGRHKKLNSFYNFQCTPLKYDQNPWNCFRGKSSGRSYGHLPHYDFILLTFYKCMIFLCIISANIDSCYLNILDIVYHQVLTNITFLTCRIQTRVSLGKGRYVCDLSPYHISHASCSITYFRILY
jgi:hypothetical protein